MEEDSGEKKIRKISIFDKDNNESFEISDINIDISRTDIAATKEFITISYLNESPIPNSSLLKSAVYRLYLTFSPEGKIKTIGTNLSNEITQLKEQQNFQI